MFIVNKRENGKLYRNITDRMIKKIDQLKQVVGLQYPGDASYPSVEQWKALNSSIGGRLVTTLPPGAVCYEPNFDQSKCAMVSKQLANPDFVVANPVQIYWSGWDGDACPPITSGAPGPAGSCGLGNYSNYVVEVESAQDVSMGVNFARLHNLRLIVKNTGHELQGRWVLGPLADLETHYC
jgi:hypothetical protein